MYCCWQAHLKSYLMNERSSYLFLFKKINFKTLSLYDDLWNHSGYMYTLISSFWKENIVCLYVICVYFTEAVNPVFVFSSVALFFSIIVFVGRVCFGWFKNLSSATRRYRVRASNSVNDCCCSVWTTKYSLCFNK